VVEVISSYKKITGKYLRVNKKRTVLTLIGIILSVALISAIGFFVKSMQEAQIRDMKNIYGSWHVMYSKVDDDLITKIKSNPSVIRSGTYGIGKELSINDNLKVKEVFVGDEALRLLPYKLREGRFPEKNTEVVMEKWFLGKIKNGAKLGDVIKVLDKEYTLVGILNDTYMNQSEGKGELITKDSRVSTDERILLAELHLNKSLGKNIEHLKRLVDEKTVIENRNLLVMQGEGMPKELIGMMMVIVGIVVISTIAVIYNAFQISVVERVKQFGLLRAVGATPKQIRDIILREAAFLALIGIPIGLAFGIIALYGIDFVFKIIGGGESLIMSVTISMDIVIISILVGLFSIYASALLPSIFAGRISPLVAISSRNSIAKEKLKKRKNLIAGRLFGFEGALASKNIKRNRKRYRTTVFSIVISVTLFITFKAFMDMSLNVYSENNESQNIHFSVVTVGDDYTEANGIDNNIIEDISKLPGIEKSYKVYNSYFFNSVIDKKSEIEDVKNIGKIYKDINYNGQNKTLLGGSLVIYDEASLEVAKSYMKEGSIDSKDLNKQNGVIIIEKNRLFNPNTENSFYGPIADLKVGDEILLQVDERGSKEGDKNLEFGKGIVNKVKVLAVLEGNPFNFRGSEGDLKMVTTEEVANSLVSKESKILGLNIEIKDLKLEDEVKADIEGIIGKAGDLRIINMIAENSEGKSVILMVKILLYGFVIVVSLIGSVNIVNTLTTNIILRRREFASLKCIGLTQKGLRKMIVLEGMLYGIMGSIYGSALGCLISYLIYINMNSMREQIYKFPIDSVAIAVAGAMLIGYISVLSPLKRIKKENLIDAVREEF
jgi:putative ABC transport system permease protein